MTTKPRIWCKFPVTTKNGELKLRIQDCTTDRLDEVFQIFVQYFAAEETFHKAAGITKSKEAQEECREFVKELVKDSAVQICCVDEDAECDIAGELVAAGIIALMKSNDPEEDFDLKTKTKEMGRMFELIFPVFDMYDAMKQLELDSLYDDRGVVVHPDYRGLGIAQKMFNVRRMICKDEGVPMTGAWMTGFGSQKAAERDGWETVFEVSYEEINKLVDNVFEDVPPTCKYMVAKPS